MPMMSRAAVAMLLLAWAAAAACGDCVLLAPGAGSDGFSEHLQFAVIEVRPEAMVRVDLCVSFTDGPGEPHEVSLLLPLQSLPENFAVRQMPLGRFQRQRLAQFDQLLREAVIERLQHEAAVESAMSLGSFAGGPVAAVLSLPQTLFRPRRIIGYGGLAEASIPAAATIGTAEARAETHQSLQVDELTALAGLPSLPQAAREALRPYVGKPFALVQLRAIPRRGRRPRAVSRPERMRALVFTFTQRMIEREGILCYEYPLGTGRAWERSIPLTQVYVAASEMLDVEVEFPRRPRTESLTDYEGNMAYLDESAAWAARGRQVHVGRYDSANPAEDIEVRLRSAGRSEFTLARAARSRHLRIARLGFPALGLLLWAAAFTVLGRTHRHAESLGFWKALAKSWGLASVVVLGPALLVYSALWGLRGRSLFELLAMRDLTLKHIILMVFFCGSLALVLGGMVVLGRTRQSGQGGFLARSLLAAVAAGGAYLLIGRALLGLLTQ